MKILSPLSRIEEVKPLAEAGAQEFYCGIVTKEWEKRFGFVASSNLRHDRVANFSSFEGLKKAVDKASDYKVPVFCVFNAHFYSEKQVPLVLRQVEQAVAAGVRKVIVSDIALISRLKAQGFKKEIALSTGNPAFNFESLQFFKGFGIERVVLPRQLTVQEIVHLSNSAKPLSLELEAFVLNAICPYADGYCTLQHIGKSQDFVKASELACRIPFEVEVVSKHGDAKKTAAKARASLWQNSFPEGCGLCALPFFKKAGIHSLKIAGRGNPLEKKLADVRLLKEALFLLEKLPEKEFSDEMKRMHFKTRHALCDSKECYFPVAGGL